jgi:hypothetical protein
MRGHRSKETHRRLPILQAREWAFKIAEKRLAKVERRKGRFLTKNEIDNLWAPIREAALQRYKVRACDFGW